MKIVRVYGLLTAVGIVVLYVVNLSGIAVKTFGSFRTLVLNSSVVLGERHDAEPVTLWESNETEVKPLDPCPRYPSALKGLRKLNNKPCIMEECKHEIFHPEGVVIEPCNLLQCNRSGCLEANCTQTGNSTITDINDSVSKNALRDVCDSPPLMQFLPAIGQFGGFWRPSTCVPQRRIAIVIPFRDRHEHLCVLLKNLIPVLISQLTEFRIFVIEQIGEVIFNKGRVMNAGFLEALKMFSFDCAIFHDVDLIPEHDGNLYDCGDQPRHLSVAIDKMNYKLMYSFLVGGVLGFKPELFRLVNGYSNEFWGWGGEDDDMALRIMHAGLRITRPPASVARYKMLTHEKRKPWNKRVEMLRTSRQRMHKDGVQNVPYRVVSSQFYTYYTKIQVDVGTPS